MFVDTMYIIKVKCNILYLFRINHKIKSPISTGFKGLLLEKYSFESESIISLLQKHHSFAQSEINELKVELDSGNYEHAIKLLYKMMNCLKSKVLNPEKTQAFEDIEYKRHIAAGIPSMYGRYYEPKFEALGLMYRLETVVSKLMEQVLQSFSREYITAKTLRQICDVLLLFKEGLALDGIYDQSFDSHLDMLKYGLESPSFSINQYINIFQFMGKDVNQIIQGYFLNVYERPVSVIIPHILSKQNVPEELQTKEEIQIKTEEYFRDILSSAFLIQELDSFITNTIETLREMIDNYSDKFIENMLTYDPDLTFSKLSDNTMNVDNPVFLGAKAFFLKRLSSYGFPVPRGFVITTEAFRHIDTIYNHLYMQRDFEGEIGQHITSIGQSSGQKFADLQNPLLLSVRSGSFQLFPGAMKTFLNVGMNDQIAETLSKRQGFGWPAWDCYRRLLQSWGMAFGAERDIFDKVMQEHKEYRGVELKIQFTGDQMRKIALDYKKVLQGLDIYFPDDSFEQLKTAIRCVLDSWSSEISVSYRDYMQVANEWGTAVMVQKMILGNLSHNSGTGVVFTSSPYKDFSSINLYGDFTICGQGEDVVSGLVNTLPISEAQRKNHYKEPLSLESAFPDIYMTLHKYAKRLIEKYGFVHQEIEFTFEDARPESLYILQTRNQTINERKKHPSFVLSPNHMKLVGYGIGVSSGVLSGYISFDMEGMKRIKEKYADAKIILARPDTVPDDIPMLFECDGLITAKGGVTSHAAVTAVGLGKVCLIKCRGLYVNESEKKCVINGHSFSSGDPVSIDGGLGNIYIGNYKILED